MPGQQNEQWGSRLAIIVAAVAMAVGTGNIWRFPRIAAEHGGGAFLIAVTVGVAIWAVPLLMSEFLMGTRSRLGNIGAFRDFMGRRFTWAGAFMVCVTAGIMFYYAVVVGWALRYTGVAVTGGLTLEEGADGGFGREHWDAFISSPIETVGFHAIAVVIAAAVVYRGIRGGLERVLKVALPALLVILVILLVRAVTLDGAEEGLRALFVPDWPELRSAQLWLEAFTQVAWSTGAGWGMMMVYAVYARQREDIAVNSGIIAVSDILVGFLAAAIILATVFSMSAAAGVGAEAAIRAEGTDDQNVGLTFIYMVDLLATMPGASVLAPLFFLALSLAGISSLIAMFELGVTNLINLGMTRQRAALAVGAAAFCLGLPSALSLATFQNQDWVWGVGLLVSGLLTATAMLRYGLGRARREINETSDVHVGAWWSLFIALIPVVFVIIFGWWIYQSVTQFHPDTWWYPFETFSVGTIALQWGAALALSLLIGGILAKMIAAGPMSSTERERDDAQQSRERDDAQQSQE